MTDLTGQNLGSYAIESEQRSDAAGRTYRARHLRLDRPVALTVIDARLAAAPDFAARFFAVLRAVAALRHPQLVEIDDFGEQDGRFFVATEWLTDGTLREVLREHAQRREPLPLARALDLARQAAEGLAYAHDQRVVHGGLTPDNLLLQRRDGVEALKVGGWGLAQLVAPAARGTFAYLAPEQCQGLAPDARSDIYALGIVLYEACTGYVPFGVKTFEEATAKHTRATPTPPRRVRPQLPEAVEALILRCLAKPPEQRFASARALADALRQLPQTLAPAATVRLPNQTVLLPTQPEPTVKPQEPTRENQPTVVAQAPAPSLPAAVANLQSPQVQVVDAAGQVIQTLNLTGDGLTVGRSAQNNVVLEHEQVSRNHLRVDWDGQRVTLTDLGSSNRTLLAGRPMPPYAALSWGARERAQIGPFTLRLLAASASAAPTQVAPHAAAPFSADPLLGDLLGGVAASSAATQAVGGARLGVQLGQEQLMLMPGRPTPLYLTLTNRGAQPDNLTLTVEGVSGRWLTGNEMPVPVAAGGQATATLTISVPRAPEHEAGDYPVIIRARSGSSSVDSGTARGRWTVLPYAASRLSLSPREAGGREAASYQVTLRNEGNAAANYLLSADDDEQTLGFAFDQDELTIEPGRAATIPLTVSARQRIVGGEEEYPFAVRADAADEPPQFAEGIFVQQALVSFWVPLALCAVLLAVALALVWRSSSPSALVLTSTRTPLLTATATLTPTLVPTPTPEPGAPLVRRFSVLPSVIAPGQPVTVTWDLANAEQVNIAQFGDVAPQGEQNFRPEQTTDFKLTATGGGKTTTRIVRVSVVAPTAAPPPTAAPSAAPPPTAALPTIAPAPPPTLAPAPPTAAPLPTAAPAPLPPTAAPPQPTPSPIDLLAAAPQARWSTQAGPLAFGAPAASPERGGWADARTNVTLEDTKTYPSALYTVPTTSTGSFVEGQFNLATVPRGQAFLADIGFVANGAGEVKAQVFFNDTLLFEATKQPSGTLLAISVDLSSVAGQAGVLRLRVSATGGTARDGLYWLRPRIAAAAQ